MKDYRITVKIRNNRILTAIEESGGTVGMKWRQEHGLSYVNCNELINLTASPVCSDGTMRPVAEKLCEVVGKLPEDLWSKEQLYPLEKNFSEMGMDYAQVVAMLPDSEQHYLIDSEIERKQTKAILDGLLTSLSEREQKIMEMRHEDEMTLVECGKAFGVSAQRVRIIEQNVLRKMRHPSIAILFKDVVNLNEEQLASCEEWRLQNDATAVTANNTMGV